MGATMLVLGSEHAVAETSSRQEKNDQIVMESASNCDFASISPTW